MTSQLARRYAEMFTEEELKKLIATHPHQPALREALAIKSPAPPVEVATTPAPPIEIVTTPAAIKEIKEPVEGMITWIAPDMYLRYEGGQWVAYMKGGKPATPEQIPSRAIFKAPTEAPAEETKFRKLKWPSPDEYIPSEDVVAWIDYGAKVARESLESLQFPSLEPYVRRAEELGRAWRIYEALPEWEKALVHAKFILLHAFTGRAFEYYFYPEKREEIVVEHIAHGMHTTPLQRLGEGMLSAATEGVLMPFAAYATGGGAGKIVGITAKRTTAAKLAPVAKYVVRPAIAGVIIGTEAARVEKMVVKEVRGPVYIVGEVTRTTVAVAAASIGFRHGMETAADTIEPPNILKVKAETVTVHDVSKAYTTGHSYIEKSVPKGIKGEAEFKSVTLYGEKIETLGVTKGIVGSLKKPVRYLALETYVTIPGERKALSVGISDIFIATDKGVKETFGLPTVVAKWDKPQFLWATDKWMATKTVGKVFGLTITREGFAFSGGRIDAIDISRVVESGGKTFQLPKPAGETGFGTGGVTFPPMDTATEGVMGIIFPPIPFYGPEKTVYDERYTILNPQVQWGYTLTPEKDMFAITPTIQKMEIHQIRMGEQLQLQPSDIVQLQPSDIVQLQPVITVEIQTPKQPPQPPQQLQVQIQIPTPGVPPPPSITQPPSTRPPPGIPLIPLLLPRTKDLTIKLPKGMLKLEQKQIPARRVKKALKVMADPLTMTVAEIEKWGKAFHPYPTPKVRKKFAREVLWKGAAFLFPTQRGKRKNRKGGLKIW